MIALETERIDRVPVARPRGDIDAANANELRERLAECMGSGVDSMVLDLSATRYLDSAGVDMLFRFGNRLRERRAKLVLVIPPDAPLARLAELVELPRAVSVRDTVEDALALCASATGAAGRRRAPCGQPRG
jgi:anti-anti-sigma factor